MIREVIRYIYVTVPSAVEGTVQYLRVTKRTRLK